MTTPHTELKIHICKVQPPNSMLGSGAQKLCLPTTR